MTIQSYDGFGTGGIGPVKLTWKTVVPTHGFPTSFWMLGNLLYLISPHLAWPYFTHFSYLYGCPTHKRVTLGSLQQNQYIYKDSLLIWWVLPLLEWIVELKKPSYLTITKEIPKSSPNFRLHCHCFNRNTRSSVWLLCHVRLWLIWDRPMAVMVAMHPWATSDPTLIEGRLKFPKTINLKNSTARPEM